MRIHLKPLSRQVIVITGASSGIGLTTAEMAARAGARVVLSSRNEADLLDAVVRIRDKGGRAFHTDALRMELEHDRVPISVSLVKPASINTPFIDHARSHMDSEPEVMPPVYPPEEVARAILECAQRPIRDVLVGGSAKFLSGAGRMAPRAMDAYLEATAFSQQKRGEANDYIDALDHPQRDGQRRGRTTRYTLKRSAYTRMSMSRAGRAIPYVAAAVAAGLMFRFRDSQTDGGM